MIRTNTDLSGCDLLVVVVSVSVGIFLGLVDLLFTEVFDVILGRN